MRVFVWFGERANVRVFGFVCLLLPYRYCCRWVACFFFFSRFALGSPSLSSADTLSTVGVSSSLQAGNTFAAQYPKDYGRRDVSGDASAAATSTVDGAAAGVYDGAGGAGDGGDAAAAAEASDGAWHEAAADADTGAGVGAEAEAEAAAAAATDAAGGGAAEWVQHYDESSAAYYYENVTTGETSWDKPEHFTPAGEH